MKRKCPIAVVGISTLFPGSHDVTGFWHDIVRKQDQIRDIPASYWLVEDYFNSDPKAEDKTYGKRGAFIDPIAFDCVDHGILPSQVQDIDTVQLMSLIVAQSVMRDAADGDFSHLDRSRMSVILGAAGGTEQMVQMGARLQRPVWLKSLREAGVEESEAQSICDRIANHYVPWSEASFPGLLGNVVAGRIANRFNLGGTNCVVDAACASSSSALLMAANELYLHNSDMVIAGGADALNDILMYMCFSKTPALSPTGDSRPFSDQADGTILGEGVGMLALRRLDDAEKDGDTIYAVIKGIGSSSDGSGTAVYAPVSGGQAQAIRRAYEDAEFAPETVELIEAHGTGTKAGDKAEFAGLNLAFDGDMKKDQKKQWCALGSIKSQIGHTKGAAGAAALIKTVLALHHKVLPPTIKVDRPNPAFDIESTPFYINTETRPWVRSKHHPRRAGVSSFGFGGSNFHVAVEEYEKTQAKPRRILISDSHLVVFGAESRSALVDQVEDELDQLPSTEASLEYLAHSSQHLFSSSSPCRLAFVVKSIDELTEKFARFKKSEHTSSKDIDIAGYLYSEQTNPGKVAVLFPGQGSQYLNMGTALATTFSDAMAAWDLADDIKDTDTRLSQVVFPRPAFDSEQTVLNRETLNQTQWTQPAIGAASLSYWALLKKMACSVDGVAGHSYGELSALHAAGVYDEETLYRLARERGELMAEAGRHSEGCMTAIKGSAVDVQALLDAIEGVSIANYNAPEQVVVTGTRIGIEALEQLCQKEKIFFTRLPVSTAFHSQTVTDAAPPLKKYIEDMNVSAPDIEVYANRTAEPYPRMAEGIATEVSEQLVSPVKFSQLIQNMYEQGYRTFIELGPGNVLSKLTSECLEGKPFLSVNFDKKNEHSLTSFWQAIGQLCVAGEKLDLAALWQAFRLPENPKSQAKAKMAVPISGINYGRIYPPKGGAADIPKPNLKPIDSPKSDASKIDTSSTWLGAFENIQKETNETHRRFLALSEQALLKLGELPSEQGIGTHAIPIHQAPVPEPDLAPEPEPVKQGASPDSSATVEDVEGIILAVISEKTGYPIDMIDPKMELENDLGIDSIKRVEILSATVDKLPGLSEFEASTMASLSTIEEIIQFIKKDLKPTEQPKPSLDIEQLMLDVVSEKTGYPIDMLELGMDLENDLGIDSIKRVEILSATVEKIPDLPEFDASQMGSLATLAHVVEFIEAQLSPQDIALTPATSDTPAPSLSRYALELRPFPCPQLMPSQLSLVDSFAITPADSPYAKPLAEALHKKGFSSRLVASFNKQDRFVICLDTLVEFDSAKTAISANRRLFEHAMTVSDAHAQAAGVFIVAQHTGGHYGQESLNPYQAWAAGGSGLCKTAACEWPDSLVRNIDIELGGPEAALMTRLVDEIVDGAAQGEVALSMDGRRRIPVSYSKAQIEGTPPLSSGDVLVVTGGGRGVTATAIQALSKAIDLRIVLLGRTQLEDTSAYQTCADQADLMKEVRQAATEQGHVLTPKALKQRVSTIQASMEIEQTVKNINDAGSECFYAQCDIKDERAVVAILNSVRDKWGQIHGVVHGAGVLADKLLSEKTLDHFDRVFDTKVDGLANLLHATQQDSLKLLSVFSSVAARTGNVGQSDYAMANEVLNRVASAYNHEVIQASPSIEQATKVTAINWGPWDSGMVNDGLKAAFKSRGIQLISPAQGADFFVNELTTNNSDTEVVIGDLSLSPTLSNEDAPQVTRFHVGVNLRDFSQLNSHRIDGSIVVPLVQVTDWFGTAVKSIYPYVGDVSLEDLSVLRGIVFDSKGDKDLNENFIIELTHKSKADIALVLIDSENRPRYRAQAIIGGSQPEPEQLESVQQEPAIPVDSLSLPQATDLYKDTLFHGPLFQSLSKITGMSEAGASAELLTEKGLAWSTSSHFCDQAAWDAALQLALVWAQEQFDLATLPMGFRRLQLYDQYASSQPARCVLQGLAKGKTGTESDIFMFDENGMLIGALRGLKMFCHG